MSDADLPTPNPFRIHEGSEASRTGWARGRVRPPPGQKGVNFVKFGRGPGTAFWCQVRVKFAVLSAGSPRLRRIAGAAGSGRTPR